MLTSTSLRHPALIAKIDLAMKEAIADFKAQNTNTFGFGIVHNKCGEHSITVLYSRYPGNPSPFDFLDCHGQNITTMVLSALKDSACEIALAESFAADKKPSNVFTLEPKVVSVKHWPAMRKVSQRKGATMPAMLRSQAGHTQCSLITVIALATLIAVTAMQALTIERMEKDNFVIKQQAEYLHTLAHDTCAEYCDGLDQAIDRVADEAESAYFEGAKSIDNNATHFAGN